MGGFDAYEVLRRGDAGGWIRWNPTILPTAQVHGAWDEAIERRGEPGFPDAIRVYAHFAYCKSSCSYCMYWHQVPKSRSDYERYVDYLSFLVERFQRRFGRTRVATAYFGGGTPGATPEEPLSRWLRTFQRAFEVEHEFTFEGWIDPPMLPAVADIGVNRLSLGVQSLSPEVLRNISRANKPLASLEQLVAGAHRLGILVNLDLVLGLPGQTIESFQADVRRLVEMGPDIVTLYMYQPVIRHPDGPPADMTYREALSESLIEHLGAMDYEVGDRVTDDAITVRLVRKDGRHLKFKKGFPPVPRIYSLFDDAPSHLVGFGPGAYGHVFGRGWFREVTAMSTLDRREPVYWGTRLSVEDECRQILLWMLAQPHRPIDLEWFERMTGVDPLEAFREPMALALSSEVLRITDGVLEREREAPSERVDEIARLLMPERPSGRPAALGANVQPELVADPRDSEGLDPDLVHTWRRLLCVPDVGRRFLGVRVKAIDERSVSFGVEAPPRTPLRVHVRKPGRVKALFRVGRFAIAYSVEDGSKLTPREKAFLRALAAAMHRCREMKLGG